MTIEKRVYKILFIIIGIAGVFIIAGFFSLNNAINKVNALLGSDDPVGNLTLLLDNKNPAVRREAIEALVKMEDPLFLVSALDNKYENVREYAIMSIDKLGDPLLLDLAPACNLEPVSSTPYNNSVSDTHPLVLLDADGNRHVWTYDFLTTWGPISREADDVQIVVCANDIKFVIESCPYEYGSKRIRIRQGLVVEIIEAASGQLIEKKTFEGSIPKNCPGSVEPNSGTKEILGSEIDKSDVKNWLEGFYN